MNFYGISEVISSFIVIMALILLELISAFFTIVAGIFGYGGRTSFYTSYINSPQWKQLASSIRFSRGNKCENCHTNKSVLDVHHLTYARIGHERPSDLKVLCRECHSNIHLRK